jgi:hypothetical protein
MVAHNQDLKPHFDVKRRTTKVNIAIVVGVAIFLLIAGLLLLRIWRDPPQTPEDVTREVNPG